MGGLVSGYGDVRMNIVVSGTSSGIGQAIALHFAEAGHLVHGIDLCDATITHPRYTHHVCDIRDELPGGLPDPEIVINSAGTLEEADAIAVNLEGAMRFVEHFCNSPSLRSVLFIASASARNGAEFSRYVASKAGIVGFMKNLALQLADRGVTCNSISPGGVITPANRHILESDELYAAVRAETLLGKWAHPSEIADLAYYLTVVNRSITGEDILVDNGEMLKSNFIW
ncbi:MAG: SDR family oxidoreductase [Coriobacteriales bacterium]|nr:SDR family oxidoreductase [Coriobacteriales bacterium]